MKDLNKKIDKLFKSRLGGKEMPYKPEYWDKMDQMLTKFPASHIASGATKILGMSKLAFISSVIAVSMFVTGSIILTIHKSNNINTKNQTENNIVKIDSNKSENNKLAQNNQTIPVETTAKVSTTQPQVSDIPSAIQPQTLGKHEATTKLSSENKTSPIQQNSVIKNVIAAKADAEQNIPKPEVVQKAVMNNQVTNDKVNPPVTDAKEIVNPIITSKTTEPAKDYILEIPKVDTTIKKELKLHDVAENIVQKPPEKPIDTFRTKKDTIIPKLTSQTLIDKIAERSKVSILLGGSMMKGFSNTTSTPGENLNFVAGLGYLYKYNDKLSFTLDGSYVRRSGSTLIRSSVRTSYFLYKETDSISLSTKSIDFLDFHLNVQRKLYDKHYLSGGLYFSTVINCLSDRNERTENPFYTIIETTEVKGYSEGISKFNYGINIDYKYHLLKNGYIGLRFNQSLNDLIDNKVYSANKKDYISEFQFYIKWMLY